VKAPVAVGDCTAAEPVRALVISTMIYPEVAEQLDSDKILVQSCAARHR